MERKIGEIFEYNGEWYQCIEGYNCKDCDLRNRICHRDTEIFPFNRCAGAYREDKKSVIFKKLEKVGEPYKHYCPSGRIIYFQRYKIFNKSYSHNTGYIMCDFNEDGIVSIEIKQTKEDMEEKKLNLKPFDLEAAKAGKPVCTRDGHKARIICFDYNGETGDYPIVALVHYNKGNKCYERVLKHTSDGLFNKYGDCQHDDDLMMLPEKKEGWVNVYRDCYGANITKDDNIYSSREAAIASAQFIDGNHYVATTKINWEE